MSLAGFCGSSKSAHQPKANKWWREWTPSEEEVAVAPGAPEPTRRLHQTHLPLPTWSTLSASDTPCRTLHRLAKCSMQSDRDELRACKQTGHGRNSAMGSSPTQLERQGHALTCSCSQPTVNKVLELAELNYKHVHHTHSLSHRRLIMGSQQIIVISTSATKCGPEGGSGPAG